MSVFICHRWSLQRSRANKHALFMWEKKLNYASTFPNTSCLRMAHGFSRIILLPLLFWTVYCECYTMFSTRFCYKQALGPAAAAHDPWRPGGPVLIFAQFFLSSGKSTRMHRSASDLDGQNRRGDGEFELPFNYLNPCFCLLLVVQIKNGFILCSVVSLKKPIAQYRTFIIEKCYFQTLLWKWKYHK